MRKRSKCFCSFREQGRVNGANVMLFNFCGVYRLPLRIQHVAKRKSEFFSAVPSHLLIRIEKPPNSIYYYKIT